LLFLLFRALFERLALRFFFFSLVSSTVIGLGTCDVLLCDRFFFVPLPFLSYFFPPASFASANISDSSIGVFDRLSSDQRLVLLSANVFLSFYLLITFPVISPCDLGLIGFVDD